MTLLHHYKLRAESRDALLDMLEAAQAGKSRPFVTLDEEGNRGVDETRIRIPYPEMTKAVIDENGEVVTDAEPTGFWLCEIWLLEPDAELAAVVA